MDFSYSPPHRLPGRLVPGKIYYEKGIEGIEGVEGVEGKNEEVEEWKDNYVL